MNERITTAAVVMLIAVAGAVPAWSPAMASFGATYTLQLNRPGDTRRFALVLGENGSAELTVADPDPAAEPTKLGGVWGADGSTIVVVLESTAFGAQQVRVTFEALGGALVVLESQPDPFGVSGMSFMRG